MRRTGYDLHVLALPRRRAAAGQRPQAPCASPPPSRRAAAATCAGFIDLATAELEAEAREPDAPVDLGGLDAVRLMTIHAAKGLEFGVVVVADLGRRGNLTPTGPPVDGDRVGLRLVGLDGSRATALDFDAIAAERRAADEAEERRVMHVAMTRAEERLILSGAVAPGRRWPAAAARRRADRAGSRPALVPGVAALRSRRRRSATTGSCARVLNSPASAVLRLEAPVAVGAGRAARARLQRRGARCRRRRVAPVARRAPGARARAARGAELLVAHALRAVRLPLPPRARARAARAGAAAEHLRDADGAAAAAAPALDLRVRGTLVHELLEGLDLAPRRALPDADAVRARRRRPRGRALRRRRGRPAGAGRRLRRQRPARAAGRGARRAPRARLRLRAGRRPLLTGFVDVIAYEADGAALIVDYKSDRVGDADLDELVEAGYGVQRRIYALAALRAGAPAVEVAHLFLERPAEPAVVRYEQADAETLDAELRAAAAPLLAGAYPVAERAAPRAVRHLSGARGRCAPTRRS